MGVNFRLIVALVLGIALVEAVLEANGEGPANFDVDDFFGFLNKLLTSLNDLVTNVKTLIDKIKNSEEGNKLLEALKKASQDEAKAAGLSEAAPLYADPSQSCDNPISQDFKQIEGCLQCSGGKWTVAITDYAKCSGNSGSRLNLASTFLVLPLGILAFLR